MSAGNYSCRTFTFLPLTYARPEDVEKLSGAFAEQGVVARFELTALRRRNAWATTLPDGVFANDYRPGACTAGERAAQFAALYETLVAQNPYRARPYPRHAEALQRDGQTFYHSEALYALTRVLEHPGFIQALLRFFRAVDDNPGLLAPPKPRRPYIPPEQRKEHFNLRGTTCRGPSWTPTEDAVLRRWFGLRTAGEHAGRHAKLSESEWLKVEQALEGRRTRASVRARIVDLNKALLAQYLVNGYLSRDSAVEYMQHVLGEKPRLPPMRFSKKRRR